MVPGMPADQESDSFPKHATTVPSSVSLIPDARPASTFSSLQETWEDIREAVTETDLYISASEKVSTASRAASSIWTLSKKVAWVVGTSALVLVVPLLYEIDKELGPGFDPAAQTTTSSSAADATSATPDSATTTGMSADPTPAKSA